MRRWGGRPRWLVRPESDDEAVVFRWGGFLLFHPSEIPLPRRWLPRAAGIFLRSGLAVNAFVRVVEAVNAWVGRGLAWALPVMTVVTLGVIFFASVLRMGWVWPGEIVVYLHGAVIMLGAAHTLARDAHVRIDLFYGRMSARRRAWVNLGGVAGLLWPVCAVVFWTSFSYVVASWETGERSLERQGLPAVFVLKTCLLAFPVLLALQGGVLAVKSWRVIRGGAG